MACDVCGIAGVTHSWSGSRPVRGVARVDVEDGAQVVLSISRSHLYFWYSYKTRLETSVLDRNSSPIGSGGDDWGSSSPPVLIAHRHVWGTWWL